MKVDRAKEIIDKFPSKKVLVVGDVVLDQYIYGKVERINPEAPVPVLHAHKQTVMSGGAGNVAKNIASLGSQAILISVTGEDDIAAEIEAAAQQEHYTVHFVRDSSRPTIRKVRYIAASQQMLRVDYEETHPITGQTEEDIIALVKEHVHDVDGLIVSDYAKGVITKTLADELLAVSRESGIPLGVDVKPSRAPWFKGATFIAPNLKEGREFLGLDPFGHNDLSHEDMAQRLHEKFDTNVFLTLSADGIYVHAKENVREPLPQLHTIQVADTSGAGDVATVILMLAQLCGANPMEAAELANAAGAVAVSKLGAIAVPANEVLEMIESLPTVKP